MTGAEQLLLLVGSGEKRKLSPAEAAVLRAGIQAMADQREQDQHTISGLNAAIRTNTEGQP